MSDTVAAPRVPAVDVARGLALAAMFVFHFTYDLGHFGFIGLQAGEDPAWRLFAKLIAGSFLALVGVGLVLASRGGLRPGPFLRRLFAVGLAAMGVTGATLYMMPESFVFFGILHCIAVSSVLALPVVRAPFWWTASMAAFVFAAPALFRSPAFDGQAWLWLGLSERLPMTVDYEPLLPWFGCVLLGVAAARLAVDQGWDARLAAWTPRDPVSRILAFGGRHSLIVYLVHQPVFFGLLSLAVAMGVPRMAAAPRAATAEDFVPACTRACSDTGAAPGYCSVACACVGERLAANRGLLVRATRGTMSPQEQATLREAAEACKPVN